jgi:DNA-binding transcriptional LysR family regulator
MRIEQLEYLVAVGKHGSLRRAGEQLHVSQPALSEAISKLERELGVSLLDRRRSGARVSHAGRELLQPIAEVLDSVARLRAAAGDQLVSRRLLRLGTVNAATVTLLLPALSDFQAEYPSSRVEVRNLQQEDIYLQLIEGQLDIGLVNLLEGDDVPPELERTPLLSGRPVAVLPAQHQLSARSSISADDLRAENFVAMRAGYLMHRFAHRLFGAHLPAEWYSADGAEMGKIMVAQGLGIALLPDYSVYGDPLEQGGLIVIRPLVDDRTTVTLAAVRRRQLREAVVVRDMIRHLRSSARPPAAAEPAGNR